MTLLKIAQIGEPVLRQVAEDVPPNAIASPEIQRFIDDLVETMRDANGAGLAANQVFRPIRVCAIEVKDNPRYPYKPNVALTVLVNPQIELLGDERFDNFEGCLSVPNLRGVVPRHARVRVRALDREGRPWEREIAGLTAGTFQHEIDHLDGKVFLDRVADTSTLTTWDGFQRHHAAAFAERARALVAHYGS